MKLLKYDQITEQQFDDYIQEWENEGIKIIPGAIKRDGKSFSEMRAKWIYEESPEVEKLGHAPSTLYFYVNEQNKIIGAISYRHKLNEKLKLHGGNIGYGVRKSERGKGNATIMLQLLLEKLKISGVEKVLLTCDENNIGSQKTIEKCGAKDCEKVLFEDKCTRKYWIYLK